MIKDYNKAVELIKDKINYIRSLSHEEQIDYREFGKRNALDIMLSDWIQERIDDRIFDDLGKLSKDVGAEIVTWATLTHEPVGNGPGGYDLDENQTVVVFKGTPEEVYEEVLEAIKGQMWQLDKKQHQRVMMEVHPDEAKYILDRKEQIEKEANIENIEYWKMKDDGPEVVHLLFWDYKKD